MARSRKPSPESILVIGLGRFGLSVATTLVDLDREVLAVDHDPATVRRWADEITHVVQADSTDGDAMRQLGVDQFDIAIVGIGSDIEASVMTVLTLAEIGVAQIWAKAVTRKHGRILSSVGAHHVVFPERAMGERVAHMTAESMQDYFEFDDGYAIARTFAPEFTWDQDLATTDITDAHDVTVVGVRRSGETTVGARHDTAVRRGDQLIVTGQRNRVEAFCKLQ